MPASTRLHAHGNVSSRNALTIALVLTSVWFGVEVAGGVLTGSLALLADAGHMLSDIGAIGLALFALWYGSRPATPTKSYGYYRTETLAALVNSSTLFLIALYVTWEAIRRIQSIQEVNSGPMIAIAAVGLGINILAAWLLFRAGGESLNVRAAFLHVLGDALYAADGLPGDIKGEWSKDRVALRPQALTRDHRRGREPSRVLVQRVGH